jgi:hypothetical protein
VVVSVRLDRPALSQWCLQRLDSEPEQVLFEAGYLSQVIGLRMTDGRDVVVKVRAWQERLIGCGQVQHSFAKASSKNDPDRTPDRLAAGLAFAFIVLLLATELVLTLPDEADSPSFVAQFYTEHRAFIIALQVLGVVEALLLGGYAWRLRPVDRLVAGAGLLMAFCTLAPQ